MKLGRGAGLRLPNGAGTAQEARSALFEGKATPSHHLTRENAVQRVTEGRFLAPAGKNRWFAWRSGTEAGRRGLAVSVRRLAGVEQQ